MTAEQSKRVQEIQRLMDLHSESLHDLHVFQPEAETGMSDYSRKVFRALLSRAQKLHGQGKELLSIIASLRSEHEETVRRDRKIIALVNDMTCEPQGGLKHCRCPYAIKQLLTS